MELQIDTSKVYAIALEGGGAKGAYQVGAWRALEEAGIRYNAVSGTSVGALNGAMMAMRDLPNAEKLWKDMRFSQVMNVDDETMGRIMKLDFENFDQVKSAFRVIRDIVRGGGVDVEPLRNLIGEWVDEEKIRNSGFISKMSRHAVHMQPDLQKAWQSARRWRRTPVVLKIDAERMHREGFSFAVSDNGVWCTERVPTQYILEIIRE